MTLSDQNETVTRAQGDFPMPMNCYECGDSNHLARDCPNTERLGDGRPTWCGTCDEQTRHYYDAEGTARRCQCHALSHQQLKQHRRCGACKQVVYAWDQAPDCDRHQLVGVRREHAELAGAAPGHRDLLTLAAIQVAESREARPVV
jgi:hypothetical protein